MAITRQDPNTIWLGGHRDQIGDMAAKAEVTPGHLVERVNTAGVWQWQKHSTAAGSGSPAVATEQSMLNKGVDDVYAAGDLMEVSIGKSGTNFWMFIPSGQNISYGAKLESAGDGTLRAVSGSFPLFVALESPGAVTALTRIRVEAL